MTFDEQVAALRGKVEPKRYAGRRENATPEQWAASLDYTKCWRERNVESSRRSSRESAARRRAIKPEAVRQANLRCYHADPDRFREIARKAYRARVATEDGRNSRRQVQYRWNMRNADRVKAERRERWLADPRFRIGSNLRRRLNKFLRGGSGGSAVRDLGCSVDDLKAHLERQFLPGMSWNNWGAGQGKWQIDHVYPLAKADLTDRLVVLAVCNWRNLRPLWSEDNNLKGDTVTPEAQQLFDDLVLEFSQSKEVDNGCEV